MKNKEKVKKLKENLNIFWNSYGHMHDVRERRAKGMIDFLLIISTFLPLLSIGLYSTSPFHRMIVLLPIIPQLISIIILLKYFKLGNPLIPWLELEGVLKEFDENKFESSLISILKKVENDTHISMNANGNLIALSRKLILSSILILIVSISIVLFEGLILSSILLILLFGVLRFVKYDEKKPDYSKEKTEKEYQDYIENWLEN